MSLGETGQKKFVGPSLYLFLDYLIVSAGSWLYWIVVSKFASVAEIGLATTVYSLVLSFSVLTQLGIEYPLLKGSITNKHRALGTAFVIEILITIASFPILLLVINNLREGLVHDYILVASVLLFLVPIEFVFRFFLLGMTNSRQVFLTDTAGISIKFITGYALTSLGYGAFGILAAYLLDILFVSAIYFLIIIRRFNIRPGNFSYVKTFFKDALVNTPSKYSGHIIFNLSIVLLASFGISNSDVGVFYIALVISVFIGSFASSMAFMVIPASSLSNQDLSSESLRLSISLISPVAVVMLTSPSLVLSLIGPQYEVAAPLLFILALGIIPFTVSINMISKLNNLNRHKDLLVLGLMQLGLFIIFFFMLVPLYGTVGASYSILISLLGSSLLAMKWLEKYSLRHIGVSCLSIVIAMTIGYVFNWLAGNYIIHSNIIALSISVTICFLVTLFFKNTSIVEIKQMLKGIFQR